MSMTPWQRHVERWKGCTRCHLQHCRTTVVLARGKLPCDVLFIGEAPGESEDALGLPFVGPAGKLLDSIIEAALSPTLRHAFTNIVACIPRDEDWSKVSKPDPVELVACLPRLKELVAMARPKLVVLVGVEASKWVNSQRTALGLDDTRQMDLTHPAYILRSNLAQQGLAIKRCIIQLSAACHEVFPQACEVANAQP